MKPSFQEVFNFKGSTSTLGFMELNAPLTISIDGFSTLLHGNGTHFSRMSFFCEPYLRTCLSGISLLALAKWCSIMYISRNMILLKLGATGQIYLASKVMKPTNQWRWEFSVWSLLIDYQSQTLPEA